MLRLALGLLQRQRVHAVGFSPLFLIGCCRRLDRRCQLSASGLYLLSQHGQRLLRLFLFPFRLDDGSSIVRHLLVRLLDRLLRHGLRLLLLLDAQGSGRQFALDNAGPVDVRFHLFHFLPSIGSHLRQLSLPAVLRLQQLFLLGPLLGDPFEFSAHSGPVALRRAHRLVEIHGRQRSVVQPKPIHIPFDGVEALARTKKRLLVARDVPSLLIVGHIPSQSLRHSTQFGLGLSVLLFQLLDTVGE